MALPEPLKNQYTLRVNNPTLDRNIGKFNLHHIWKRVKVKVTRTSYTTNLGL